MAESEAYVTFRKIYEDEFSDISIEEGNKTLELTCTYYPTGDMLEAYDEIIVRLSKEERNIELIERHYWYRQEEEERHEYKLTTEQFNELMNTVRSVRTLYDVCRVMLKLITTPKEEVIFSFL